MKKYNTFEDFLKTLVKPSERTIIPGTIAREGKEYIYFSDDGSGFSKIFKVLTKHKGENYAQNGSLGEERCKLFTPDNILFYAISYKGDLEGWRKDIELGAQEHGITLAWVDGEDFVLSDGKSYKLSQCKAEFY